MPSEVGEESPYATKIEVGINNLLGTEVERVDEKALAQAVRLIATSLDGQERQRARYLAYAIADALDQEGSYWKLTLSRPQVMGPHITIDEKWRRFYQDADIATIVTMRVAEGVKKESAKQEAMTKYKLSASAVDKAIGRVNRRIAVANAKMDE